MPRPATLQLGALLHGSGGSIAGAHATGGLDFAFHARLARTLEDAGFAAILVDDVADSLRRTARADCFEPFTLLSALSSVTERIGLVATASASDDEPYTIARKLASLDHLSGGRAGWSVLPLEAATADQLYARAAEFVDVVEGLWDTVADGAMIRDKASGIYVDRAGRRPLDHHREHFRVAGPLNIARPPQGRPVLVQAGLSDAGRAFAARSAEVILTAPQTLQQAIDDRSRLDVQLADLGRDPGDVRVWPLLSPIVADTDAAAQEALATMGALIREDLLRRIVQDEFGDERFASANTVAGSAATVADRMTDWHASGAIDGFTIAFPPLPESADRFTGEVLPLLADRGVFTPPAAGTLREQLGLPRPARTEPPT